MNVHVLGDKTEFLSKNSVIRLKSDIKEKKTIDYSKYLKDGFNFKIEIINNDTYVYIIQIVNLEAKKQKEQRHLELRNKIRQLSSDSKKESNNTKKKMESLKRTVPTNIYNSYTRLLSRYKLDNIPAPDDVINNVDKYKLQISAVMGKIGKISNDARASNDIRNYFITLGEFLGIEPLNIDMIKPDENIVKKNDDTDEETSEIEIE